MRYLSIILLCLPLWSSTYGVSAGKAYQIDDADLRIITNQGSRRLPLFGTPVTILIGTRPYVLTSQALFAVDASKEEISAVLRLDRSYSGAVIGKDDRIYLLGADALNAVQGSQTKFSILYTYALPSAPDRMFLLPSGNIFFSGQKSFVYDPAAKNTTDASPGWTLKKPSMSGNVLIESEGSSLHFYNVLTKESAKLDLASEVKQIAVWRDKILASTSAELMLVDPLSARIVTRRPYLSISRLSAVDSDTIAVALVPDGIITMSLPSLEALGSYNASCADGGIGYPFFGKPLFICGEKLALPGGTRETEPYLVQPVKPQDGSYYALQVGAFSNLASVGPLMERLANQGLPYYTLEDASMTKFRVGYFKTRADAERIRSYLSDINAWIVTEKNPQNLIHSIHDLNHDVRPDGIVAKGDSVIIITLRDQTWIEVLKASKLPESATEVYLQGNKAYAKLEKSGLRELVLPDSTQ